MGSAARAAPRGERRVSSCQVPSVRCGHAAGRGPGGPGHVRTLTARHGPRCRGCLRRRAGRRLGWGRGGRLVRRRCRSRCRRRGGAGHAQPERQGGAKHGRACGGADERLGDPHTVLLSLVSAGPWLGRGRWPVRRG